MKAVVMAGGEGTRLRPLTSNQPKPMMPMANRPLMKHVVRRLAFHGFDDIVVTVAFLASHIRNYFGDGSELGVDMRYATEETPLGTVVISLLIDGSVPAVVAWGVLVREVLISAAVLVLAAAGARRIDVQWAGKAGTLALMVAFPLFMMGTPGPWGRPALVIAWGFAVSGLVLGWYAAATYVPMARRALADGRAARMAS